jgi:hypothetical protein
VLLHEVQELLGGLPGEFRRWSIKVQRRKTGGAQRRPQNDAVLASQKDVGNLFRRTSDALDAEPLPEQRFARIDHFRPKLAILIRVVEGGIKKWCRSIVSTMTS